MNGFAEPLISASHHSCEFLCQHCGGLLADGVFSSINWLWLVGGAVAVWLIVSAMGRRQTRLTQLLRDHVKKHNDANMPPDPAPPTEDSSP
jgi:hypothetical protein